MSVLHNEYDNGLGCNDGSNIHSHNNSNNHNEWQVDIFRHTEVHGWQQQLPIHMHMSMHMSTDAEADDERKTNHEDDDGDGCNDALVHASCECPPLTVAPRKDCIVIPLLRQKFTLNKDHTTMVQRGNSILLVSDPSSTLALASTHHHEQQQQPHHHDHDQHQQRRAMVLRFRSKRECCEFSSAFLRCNPPKRSSTMASTAATATANATTSNRSGRVKDSALAYMARLLHDDDFLGFVNKLESQILQSSDGRQIMEGLLSRQLQE